MTVTKMFANGPDSASVQPQKAVTKQAPKAATLFLRANSAVKVISKLISNGLKSAIFPTCNGEGCGNGSWADRVDLSGVKAVDPQL